MQNWKQAEHLRLFAAGPDEKPGCVVDDHQYALLFWQQWFEKSGRPAVLVSLDFHPDTDPPFWLYSYQKALAEVPDIEDTDRLEQKQRGVQKQLLGQMDARNAASVVRQMPKMNNDEQIRTAMALGIFKDYHMINCMAEHHYGRGTHYLVPKTHFGDLSDAMFKSCGFSLEKLSLEDPLILDIDLDYFPRPAFDSAGAVFKTLVQRAEAISVARSRTYFDYLKDQKEKDFTMQQCEGGCLALLNRCLE
ncbi:MAG: hypothetical protein ACI39G_04090 [Pseudoramibacter sp.]